MLKILQIKCEYYLYILKKKKKLEVSYLSWKVSYCPIKFQKYP